MSAGLAKRLRWLPSVAAAAMLWTLPTQGVAQHAVPSAFVPLGAPLPAQPPVPSTSQFSLQLMLDDNQQDGAFGLTGGLGARQFLWFNRFALNGRSRLEQIWVLFPAGPNMAVGAPVQLVVYVDDDGNPANGAQFLASFDRTIGAANGVDFSVYTIPGGMELPATGDVLLGVVPRFINSGVTPITNPAALDTTMSQGRSWVAVWSGDPPNPPTLPPNVLITTIDGLQAGGGNFMIRGFGTAVTLPDASALTIPALSEGTLALLVLSIAAVVLVASRRE